MFARSTHIYRFASQSVSWTPAFAGVTGRVPRAGANYISVKSNNQFCPSRVQNFVAIPTPRRNSDSSKIESILCGIPLSRPSR